MNNTDYENLCLREGAIPLGHPEFDKQFHTDWWGKYPVTIIVCQRKTPEFIRLCVESILRFYPDIPILIMDGDSQDSSTSYLQYKQLTTPNLRVHNFVGRNSHGEILDYAIRNLVTTEFVLTMDSDTIVNRGTWIDEILYLFQNGQKNWYAIGHLMLVSRSNYGVGASKDVDDVLRYAHPSCSMFRVSMYKELSAFNDNGSPCAQNMIDAEKAGLAIHPFPIDKYVSHRMGVSWVKEHQIIWKDDYDVLMRPLVTFVITNPEQIVSLGKQTEKDFDMITMGNQKSIRVWVDNDVDVLNKLYDIRFRVTGEYVCVLPEQVQGFPEDFITTLKQTIIEQQAPESLFVNGIRFVQRKLWQSNDSLDSV